MAHKYSSFHDLEDDDDDEESRTHTLHDVTSDVTNDVNNDTPLLIIQPPPDIGGGVSEGGHFQIVPLKTRNNHKCCGKVVSYVLVVLCIILSIALIHVTWKYMRRRAEENKANTGESGMVLSSGSNKDGLRHFVHLSDLHLDLFYSSKVASENEQHCRKLKTNNNNNNKRKSGRDVVVNNKITTTTSAVFGRIGCDSPQLLLNSLSQFLTTLVRKENKSETTTTTTTTNNDYEIDFVLITGDHVAHFYDDVTVNTWDNIIWSIGNSTRAISDALPHGVPIFVAMGNHDLPLNYHPPLTSHDAFYQSLFPMFRQFVFPTSSGLLDVTDAIAVEFRKTFLDGGYYSIPVDDGNLLVVVLNTNYWALRAYNIDNYVTVIGDMQMEWFRKLLSRTRSRDPRLRNKNKQKILITGHIPPGVDSYDGTSFWLDKYTEEYVSLMTSYADLISGQLFGHNHKGEMRILTPKRNEDGGGNNNNSLILLGPSITPYSGTNPSFRVYDYSTSDVTNNNNDVTNRNNDVTNLNDVTNHNGDVTLEDFTQFYLDLPNSNVNKHAYWLQEYSFKTTFKTNLTSHSVEQLLNKFVIPGSSAWSAYSLHMSGKMGGVFSYERFEVLCAAKYYDITRYNDCKKKYRNFGT